MKVVVWLWFSGVMNTSQIKTMVVSFVNKRLVSRDLDSTKVECYTQGFDWYVSSCRWNAPYTHDECNALQSFAPQEIHARSMVIKALPGGLEKLNQAFIHTPPLENIDKSRSNFTNGQTLEADTKGMTTQWSDVLKKYTRLSRVRPSTNVSVHDRPALSHVTVSCS
jgi:hypothetical protein